MKPLDDHEFAAFFALKETAPIKLYRAHYCNHPISAQSERAIAAAAEDRIVYVARYPKGLA